MAYDYDKLYGETRDALGEPTARIVGFFDSYEVEGARILDVGCGQGRDALFLARRGHRVVGVDLSPNGIRDLVAVAEAEDLAVEGVVADLSDYTPDGIFDVILIDRTLHMLLDEALRLAVLARLLTHVGKGGWVVIADEAANMAGFRGVLEADARKWDIQTPGRGYLFAQRG